MFLVAGELVDSGGEIRVRDYEPPEDPWKEWLTRFLGPTYGLWISDQRDPVPPRYRLHSQDPPPKTWRHLSNADFDRELHLEDVLVVSASTETFHGDLYQSVSVNSALATPESAESLLASLQDTPTPRAYALPTEDSHHEIDEPGFELLGWLVDNYLESTGLDEHDPVCRINLRTVVPGWQFQRILADRHSANEWQSDRHPLPGAIRILRWSDEPTDIATHYHPRYAKGHQTLVKIPELLTFLSTVGKDLILKVMVSRNFASSHRMVDEDEQKERYDSGTARIYLLKPNGAVVDGMGRSLQIGTSDRLTAQDR